MSNFGLGKRAQFTAHNDELLVQTAGGSLMSVNGDSQEVDKILDRYVLSERRLHIPTT